MAVRTRTALKNWFKRGLKPLEAQFADWIDSFWHMGDDIPMESIDGLEDALNDLATSIGSGGVPANVVIDCGDYDASSDAWPTTGGTGTDGAVVRGNQFDISVAGTLDGTYVAEGTTIRYKGAGVWRIIY
jgi:hypothetical protein